MKKVVLISDTHGKHSRWKLPDGDILIHAGDVSSIGTEYQIQLFLDWFQRQKHKHKIFIAGNHDFFFESSSPDRIKEVLSWYPGITYLNDSGVEIEGIKIWGSPWQPGFHNWAFNYYDIEDTYWNKIPEDTRILITHGPPRGILDVVVRGNKEVGCPILLERTKQLEQLQLHVFGHIHEGRGSYTDASGTMYFNVSMLNEDYQPHEIIPTLTL